MKSRAYMKGAEFIARQGWLPFVDAVGMVLQVLEPVKAKAWQWFREWKKARYKTLVPTEKAEQLNLWPALTINQFRLDYV